MSVPNEEVRQQLGFIVRLLQSLNLPRFLSAKQLRNSVDACRLLQFCASVRSQHSHVWPTSSTASVCAPTPSVLAIALVCPDATVVRAVEEDTATTDAQTRRRRHIPLLKRR